jgi:endonuclease NucS-like protein
MDNVRSSKRFPLKEAYAFGERRSLANEVNQIKNMEIEWDRKYTSTVRRGRLAQLFQNNSLLLAFQQECWPLGATPEGQADLRRCLKVKTEYDAFLAGNDGDADSFNEADEAESLEFAIEAHLRDFLAKNLGVIEPGLRLYATPGMYLTHGNSGVEFPVDDGRIDILAEDRDGKYVCIELKLSRGKNKALGQLLYYMAWVDKHLGDGPCRGLIVANEINQNLIMAISRAPGVRLARYRMSFSVDWVVTEDSV